MSGSDGYLQLDRRGAELLFQVLTEPEEKTSVAIASNESFADWGKTFTEPRLCAAIVDRLTFGGNIIETGTESCGSAVRSPVSRLTGAVYAKAELTAGSGQFKELHAWRGHN